MDTFILSHKGNPLVIQRRTSRRARKLSLRFIPEKSSFILTIPPRTSGSSVKIFLNECTGWIEKTLPKIEPRKPIEPGDSVILFGVSFTCVADPLLRHPRLCEETLTLRLSKNYTHVTLHEVFKKRANLCLTPYVLEVCGQLQETVEKITFRDTRTRWGSCSINKTISLNWRLILAPPEVAKYVCVHEAVHLLHMNHSPAFWNQVAELCPDYKAHRRWLRYHGHSLKQLC